jgi:hypothetical protein
MTSFPLFNPGFDREIHELIATRNRPMLTALEICIDQLERFAANDRDVHEALWCARRAIDLEQGFQARR